MNQINEIFNTYLDVPFDVGTLFLRINIVLNNILYQQYDTQTFTGDDFYNILTFDGVSWIKLSQSKKINTSIVKKIVLAHKNSYNNCEITYEYYNDLDEIIYSSQLDVIPPTQQYNNNINIEIGVPFLIDDNNPILKWQPSLDLDNDDISYQIELYKNQNLINTYNNIQQKINGFIIFQIPIQLEYEECYKWRVRSLDTFGEYSEWSVFYHFKCILVLNNILMVINNVENYLNNILQVTINNQLLHHNFKIKGTIYQDINNTLQVVVNNQLLHHELLVGSRYDNQLYNTLQVVVNNQLLHHELIIISNNQLNNTLQVVINNQLLHHELKVRKSSQLNHELKVFYIGNYDFNNIITIVYTKTFDNIIVVKRQFQNSLSHVLPIVLAEIQPLQIQVYNSQDNLVVLDNRIKIYDINSNEIKAYDYIEDVASVGGSLTNIIKLYPYNQSLANNELIVYNKYGEIINNYYDINNNLITVYTDENKIKNWLPNGEYYIKYNSYPDAEYYYDFDNDGDYDFSTNSTLLHFSNDFIDTNPWTFKIKATKNNMPLHYNHSEDYLYTANFSQDVQQPIYLNDFVINNHNIIDDALPLIKFGRVDYDNTLKYHLKISLNINFSENILDVYLDQVSEETDVLYKLQSSLVKQGKYYIYISSCKFIGNEMISETTPIIKSFSYNFKYVILNHWLCIGFRDWQTFGNKLIVRTRNDFNNKIVVMHNYNDELNHTLYLCKKFVKIDFNNKLVVRTRNNLSNKIIVSNEVTNEDNDLSNEIIVFKEIINEDNNLQHKIMIYKEYCEYDFNNICQIFVRYNSDLNSTCFVMQRYDANYLNHQCIVWNKYVNPYYSNLYSTIMVSNWVNSLIPLNHTLIIFYEEPPMVVITADIEQGIWQTQYRVHYQLSLQQDDMTIPFKNYIYILDKNPETIPDQNNGTNLYSDSLLVDLRTIENSQTGKFYLHVRSKNIKNVLSSYTTTYVVYYNHGIDVPNPLAVNGQSVLNGQIPVVTYTNNITFSWQKVIDFNDWGDIVTYQIQISDDATFNIVTKQSGLFSGQTYNLLPRQLPPSKYYWRVRAFDGNEYSDWSIIVGFYINKLPDAPTKLSVKNYS